MRKFASHWHEQEPRAAATKTEEHPMPRFRAQQIQRIAFLVVYAASIVITCLDVFVWRNQ